MRSLRLLVALTLFVALAANAQTFNHPFAAVGHGDWLALFQVDDSGNLNMYSLPVLQNGSMKSAPWGNVTSAFPKGPDLIIGPASNVPPVALANDPSTAYVFYATNAAQNVMTSRSLALAVVGPNQVRTFDISQAGRGATLPAQVASIGAALLPPNPADTTGVTTALVAYKGDDGQLHLDAWWFWPMGSPAGQNLATFSASNTWDGNVSIAVRQETADLTNTTPFALYISTRNGSAIDVGRTMLGFPDPTKPNSIASPQWKSVTPTGGILAGSTPVLQRAADGRLFVAYLDNTQATSQYAVTPPGLGGLQYAGKFVSTPSLQVPSVAYTYGQVSTSTPLQGQPSMQQITIPVYRTILSAPKPDDPTAYMTPALNATFFETAYRTPLPGVISKQEALIGIIEGPPPIPNENIRITGPGASSPGTTTFGTANETSNDSSYTVETSSVTSNGLHFGVVDWDLDKTTSTGRDKSAETSTESMITQSAYAEVVKDNGQWRVAPGGAAFVYGATFLGWRYHFVDAGGNPIAGAPDQTDIFATSPTISVLPFDFDTAGDNGDGTGHIVPGDLMSYKLDSASIAQLQAASKYRFQNGNVSLHTSWAEGSQVEPESEIVTTESTTDSWDVDVASFLGVGVEGEGMSWAIQSGSRTSISSEQGMSTQSRTSLTSGVDLLPANDAPGTYTSYGYDTYLLQGSPDYRDELVAMLKKNPTVKNQQLLGHLTGDPAHPGTPVGSPWKITYVVNEGDYNQIPTSSMTSAPPIPRSLVARGIDTPAKALHAKRDLSPAEAADLHAYTSALRKMTDADFARRHPQWKRRRFAPPAAKKQPAPAIARIDYAAGQRNPSLTKATLVKQQPVVRR